MAVMPLVPLSFPLLPAWKAYGGFGGATATSRWDEHLWAWKKEES